MLSFQLCIHSMKRKIAWIGLILMILACEKSQDLPTRHPFLQAPVNTGYYAFDQNGSYIRQVGNPNVKNGTFPYQTQFRIFPNPTAYSFSDVYTGLWYVSFNSEFEGKEKKIWVMKARYQEIPDEGTIENGRYYLKVGAEVVYETTTMEQILNINLSNPSSRDYRLYVEIDGKQYHDNLAIRARGTY